MCASFPTKSAPGKPSAERVPNGYQDCDDKTGCAANAGEPASNAGRHSASRSQVELPPVIRRTELVAFSLAGLLIICIVAVLYFAKAFFLPVVMAFIVGTMLSPAASFLERCRIPRALARRADRDRGRRRWSPSWSA